MTGDTRGGSGDETRGLLYLMASTVSYGSLPILAKLAFAAGVSTSGLLAWRFGGAILVSAFLARRSPRLEWSARLKLWGLGLIFVANTLTYFAALQVAPASTVSLLVYTYPVMVTLLASGMGMERLTVRSLGAAVLVVAGSALTAEAAAATSPRGVVLALATAVIYGGYVALGSRLAAGVPSDVAAHHVTQVCAVIYVPWVLLRGGLALPPSATAWLTVAALCVFCTVVPIRAFLAGLERVGPARAAVISSLELVVTMVLAAVFLRERIGLRQWLGGALILGGVMVQNLGALRRMGGAGRASATRSRAV
jgi:drug/metabolite transporter (DMT)-like permease